MKWTAIMGRGGEGWTKVDIGGHGGGGGIAACRPEL